MKKQILIIEDNYYRYFTTKQVLETKTKIRVNVMTANDPQAVRNCASNVGPDIILFKPKGGIIELLDFLQKKDVNRRNTEISMILVPAAFTEETIDLRALGRRKSRKTHDARAA